MSTGIWGKLREAADWVSQNVLNPNGNQANLPRAIQEAADNDTRGWREFAKIGVSFLANIARSRANSSELVARDLSVVEDSAHQGFLESLESARVPENLEGSSREDIEEGIVAMQTVLKATDVWEGSLTQLRDSSATAIADQQLANIANGVANILPKSQ